VGALHAIAFHASELGAPGPGAPYVSLYNVNPKSVVHTKVGEISGLTLSTSHIVYDANFNILVDENSSRALDGVISFLSTDALAANGGFVSTAAALFNDLMGHGRILPELLGLNLDAMLSTGFRALDGSFKEDSVRTTLSDDQGDYWQFDKLVFTDGTIAYDSGTFLARMGGAVGANFSANLVFIQRAGEDVATFAADPGSLAGALTTGYIDAQYAPGAFGKDAIAGAGTVYAALAPTLATDHPSALSNISDITGGAFEYGGGAFHYAYETASLFGQGDVGYADARITRDEDSGGSRGEIESMYVEFHK
jgi:hypothetical protein